MKARSMVLLSIILGLCINLFADLIWHYLPDKGVYPYTYVVVTGAIVFVCILLIIFGKEDSTKGFLAKLWQKLVPRKTVIFVQDTTYEAHQHWHNAELCGEPAMSIHRPWYVTNLTDEPIWILRASLEKPRTEAMMVLTKDPEGDLFDRFPILPRNKTEVIVDLCIQPPICKQGESFKGKIVFIDHFGKKHKVKVTFKSRPQEGELILSVRSSVRYQDELNSKVLPKSIRKKLQRKGVSFSNNLSISVQDTKWEIKAPEKPQMIYTAKIEGKKLNLYKCFVPPPRQISAVAPASWTRA